MADMLPELQACSTQLCGSSAFGNPEAVAQLIAEKATAMNISSGDDCMQDSLPERVTSSPPGGMALQHIFCQTAQ